MIQPLEEKRNPGEYINRVKRVEHDHGPGSRDFAYEVGEISEEQQKRRQPPHEFGEDTYEHSEEEAGAPEAGPNDDARHGTTPPPSDEGSLDITI
ncbi:MAG TPA: hypothetical protein VGL38_10025 [bacterium]|jgi:hypothetical protein